MTEVSASTSMVLATRRHAKLVSKAQGFGNSAAWGGQGKGKGNRSGWYPPQDWKAEGNKRRQRQTAERKGKRKRKALLGLVCKRQRVEGQEGKAGGQRRVISRCNSLAQAVEGQVFQTVEAFSFHSLAQACSSLAQVGCALAWTLVNTEKVFEGHKALRFLTRFLDPGMWQRAGTRRLALPICEGELSKLREALQTQTLAEVVVETFTAKWCEDAWMYACFCACN